MLRLLTAALAVAAPARAADTLDGWSFHYGDPHAHTGLSHDGYATDVGAPCLTDGDCGAFADVFETAVANGLDWVVLSDHVNGSEDYATTDAEFQTLIQMDLHHDDPGADLLVIPGAEVWFVSEGDALGHKNLLLFGDSADLETLALSDVRHPDPLEGCDAITAWMDDLTTAFGDALLIPHHTMMVRPMPTDWSCHTDYEVGVEVYSAWGNSLGGDDDYDEPAGTMTAGSVHSALDPDGYALQMGFLAGTDAHTTQPGVMCKSYVGRHVSTGGLTMAVLDEAEALDAGALYDAIVEHRTLATTGPRVPLVVTLEDTAGTTWTLGQDVELPAGQAITVSVAVEPSAVAAVTGVWFVTPDGRTALEPTGTDAWGGTMTADGTAWGYVAVQLSADALGLCDDGNGTDEDWVWASPWYITTVDHDDDADGVTYLAGDCDDTDASVHPGAPEGVADGLDQDCDGLEACYADADADGFRADTLTTSAGLTCDGPGEATPDAPADDCNDADASVFPGAEDAAGDGVDADCDGLETCYTDADGDGARTDVSFLTADLACAGPGAALASAADADCDDADPTTYVGAPEVDCTDPVDHDCDGVVRYADDDADGWAACVDCDDTDPAVSPDAAEQPGDAVDSDCDGAERCYVDADADGYRTDDTLVSADTDCDDPGEARAEAPADDCDDADADVHPDADEPAGDSLDSDCDSLERCYVDADADGHRTGDGATVAAADLACASAGLADRDAPADDCDDRAPDVHPDAADAAGDGTDSDCDGLEQCYVDADGDGYRNGDATSAPTADLACAGAGLADGAAPSGDCDDADAGRHPDAAEGDCTDPVDWNCDGSVGWSDADADGWAACEDCDDAAADVHPGADDAAADGLDADCDGLETCLVDGDGDGWAAADSGESAVVTDDVRCVEDGHVRATGQPGDCDDADPDVHPDAWDAPADGVDADCDALERCYVDADADGYRSAGERTLPTDQTDCGAPGLTTADAPAGDCDDRAPDVHPGADEAVDDGVDSDCDGVERCWVDADNDGYRQGAAVTDAPALDCGAPGAWSGAYAAVDCDDADARVGRCPELPELTEPPAASPPDAPPDAPACGCASTGAAPNGLLGLGLAWLALRRRR